MIYNVHCLQIHVTEGSVEIRSEPKPQEVRNFPLSIVKIDRLLPHEEIIEPELVKLMEDLKSNGILKYPVVVSKNTYVILDGHHRYSALKELDFEFAPVILLDYDDDDLITVDTWYPIVDISLADFIENLPKDEILETNDEGIENLLNQVKTRHYTALIGNSANVVAYTGSRRKLFKIIRNRYLESTQYADNPQVALNHAGHDRIAVIAWSYTKKEIVEKAQAHQVFLPKTTRHTIKYRYAPINFELGKLKNIHEELIVA